MSGVAIAKLKQKQETDFLKACSKADVDIPKYFALVLRVHDISSAITLNDINYTKNYLLTEIVL